MLSQKTTSVQLEPLFLIALMQGIFRWPDGRVPSEEKEMGSRKRDISQIFCLTGGLDDVTWFLMVFESFPIAAEFINGFNLAVVFQMSAGPASSHSLLPCEVGSITANGSMGSSTAPASTAPPEAAHLTC